LFPNSGVVKGSRFGHNMLVGSHVHQLNCGPRSCTVWIKPSIVQLRMPPTHSFFPLQHGQGQTSVCSCSGREKQRAAGGRQGFGTHGRGLETAVRCFAKGGYNGFRVNSTGKIKPAKCF
jgi:hypothetical protein